ncbi:MAG: alpha/beta hydrolase [Azospirillaceae bacterium]|nr:alpha/beta hydrolase [Azospirillaceae bacterium]
MKLDFSKKAMDIGTAEFNFMRTLMVAGTGGAEVNECFLALGRIKANDPESWVREWALLADRRRQAAEAAIRSGQAVTGRQAYLRASNYYRCALFSLPHTDKRLTDYLTLSRHCFHQAAALFPRPIETLSIPFGDARLPAYFIPAEGDQAAPHPTLLVLNGGDSTGEEMTHWLGFAAAARGWNCLVLEGPGQWSALQLNPGLYLRPDYEVPVKAAIDYLTGRDGVDRKRIALFGPSLGSLLAARAVAFEGRIRACVCQGLVVDVYEAWHAVWPRVLQKAPVGIFDAVFSGLEKLSPQLHGMANHFRWMLGVTKPHAIIDAWRPYHVGELAPRIACPMLVLYGEAEAAQSDETVALSALRFIAGLPGPVSLQLFGFDEGWAATHCQVGALAAMQALVFGWLDTAVNHPDELPAHDIGDNVATVFAHHIQGGDARKEAEGILTGMAIRR